MSSKKNSARQKGRPLSSPLPRTDQVTIRLNKAELDALSRWAWRYDLSMSEAIRDALMILSIIPDSHGFKED